MTQIKTPAEIDAMREGGAMLAEVLRLLAKEVKPGVSTAQLDRIARDKLTELGAKPAFLGYYGFPAALCVSVNDEVVHGIPSSQRIIKNGDIVSYDFGVLHKGLITDAAMSVIAGTAKTVDAKLVDTTRRSLEAAIDVIKNGVRTGSIGAAVQKVLQASGFGIVRDYVGHGVGHKLHESPNIPNLGLSNQGPALVSGMTIAVEPMATSGDYHVYVDEDGWTVKTKDGSKSAHFEHTILITDNGAEVLTAV